MKSFKSNIDFTIAIFICLFTDKYVITNNLL